MVNIRRLGFISPGFLSWNRCLLPLTGVNFGRFFPIPWETVHFNNQLLTDPYCYHRWALTVLHYPRNKVICQHPLIGVIYMVILHVFIIKNHPNWFSNYYPKSIIWVIYPFILNFGEFIHEVTFTEHYLIIQEEIAMLSYYGIMFPIEIQ